MNTPATENPTHLARAAVGRVVRAITYPVVSHEFFDMTLRELNALATLAHVNTEAKVGATPDEGCDSLVDSSDAMRIMPGAGQAFWAEEQYTEAFEGLQKKGLVKFKKTHGKRLSNHMKEEIPGLIVTLTKKGEALVDAMAGNIGKSLNQLNDEVTSQELRCLGGIA